MARQGFRIPASDTARQASAEGPGPNCPIRYTVDPDRGRRDACVEALRLLRRSGKVDPATVQRTLDWLQQWHKENDRLSWFYTTLRFGLGDPTYAPLFQAFHKDLSQYRFLIAPNQVGKSYAAIAEVLFFAISKHPWREIDAKWGDPSIEKTILIVTGSEKNRDGIYQALWALAPISDIDWVSTHYDRRNMWGVRNPVIVIPATNTKIIFRSSNQDTDSLNSLTADLILIDEPPAEGTVDEIRRAGTARNAPVIMSFTPVGEEGEDFSWLRDYVEGDEEYRLTEGRSGSGPRSAWSKHKLGIPDCPWFDPEELEKRRTMYREEQTPQRLFGEWEGAATNRAFTHFKESGVERTVTDTWKLALATSPEKLKFAVGLDHGEKAATQVAVLVAFDMDSEDGICVVLDEYVSRTKTTCEEDARGIRDMLAKYDLQPEDISLWIGDINTAGKEAHGEKLNMILGRALGVHIRIPYKYNGSVATEERRMNHAFKAKKLVVHSRCRTVTKSLRHYKGDGCEADKKLKHSLDALRYIMQNVLDKMRVAMVYSREYTGKKGTIRFREREAA